jgi:hypothetical protein
MKSILAVFLLTLTIVEDIHKDGERLLSKLLFTYTEGKIEVLE